MEAVITRAEFSPVNRHVFPMEPAPAFQTPLLNWDREKLRDT